MLLMLQKLGIKNFIRLMENYLLMKIKFSFGPIPYNKRNKLNNLIR